MKAVRGRAGFGLVVRPVPRVRRVYFCAMCGEREFIVCAPHTPKSSSLLSRARAVKCNQAVFRDAGCFGIAGKYIPELMGL